MKNKTWCDHVGGFGPPFPLCKICASRVMDTVTITREELRAALRKAPAPLHGYEVEGIIDEVFGFDHDVVTSTATSPGGES